MNRTFSRRWSSALKQVVCSSLLSSAIAGGSAWADEPIVAEATPAAAASAIATPSLTDVNLTYPGSPKEGVVKFLEDTLARYHKAQEPLENVYVKGRISRETAPYVPGKKEIQPEPKWHDFLYVSKDGHRRFQRGYAQRTSDGSSNVTIYRHMDPDAMYKMDGPSLALYPVANIEAQWGQLSSELAIFTNVYDLLDGKSSSIDEFISKTVDRIANASEQFHGSYSVKCHRTSEITTISYRSENQTDKDFKDDFTEVCFSESLNGAAIRSSHSFGTPLSGVHLESEAKLEYEEIAPGVFYPKAGHCLSFLSGTGIIRNELAGWVRNDLQVESVEFGDFECDKSLLTAKGLPIQVGANVEDYRSVPVKLYTFGKSPIEESVLEQTAPSKKGPPLLRVLLSLAVTVGAFIACCGFKRRQSL